MNPKRPHWIANQMLDRIEKLLGLGDESALGEAIDLSYAAAQMDYGNRKDVFDRDSG